MRMNQKDMQVGILIYTIHVSVPLKSTRITIHPGKKEISETVD